MTADRKKEAREKFLLGGIVVRAGLSKADRAYCARLRCLNPAIQGNSVPIRSSRSHFESNAEEALDCSFTAMSSDEMNIFSGPPSTRIPNRRRQSYRLQR